MAFLSSLNVFPPIILLPVILWDEQIRLQIHHNPQGPQATDISRTRLELELRIMNDVALIGMPNAGKTSLLVTWGKCQWPPENNWGVLCLL